MTKIKAKKDLYNDGKCFTKNKVYTVNRYISIVSSLMDCAVINDQNQQHYIGSWWVNFEIV